VPVGEIGLRVEVEKGMRVEGREVELTLGEVHEVSRRRKMESVREAHKSRRFMRRL
jgi:hypothetical protein